MPRDGAIIFGDPIGKLDVRAGRVPEMRTLRSISAR